mgnify:CR=1 FL=1
MITIEALKNYGANTEEGLARCMNNEAFYLRMVGMGLADANFEKLPEAVAAGDAAAAFEAAHALKGIMGNLALTPLYTPISELTEVLRGKTELGDIGALMDEITEKLAKARALNA